MQYSDSIIEFFKSHWSYEDLVVFVVVLCFCLFFSFLFVLVSDSLNRKQFSQFEKKYSYINEIFKQYLSSVSDNNDTKPE